MKKIIILSISFAVLAAGLVLGYIEYNKTSMNSLLMANLAILAHAGDGYDGGDSGDGGNSGGGGSSSGDGDEYHQGQPGTNWETYTIRCVAYGPTSSSGSWYYDSSIGVYVFTAGGGIGGSGSSMTNFEPFAYRKDICGYGAGICLTSAPSGHPCMG